MFSFNGIIIFIVNLIRKSLQLEINDFTKIKGTNDVTKQAFSKARRKLNPIVFTLLNEKLISEFYTDNEFKTFKGFRVIAVDGSKIQLPSSKEILKFYGSNISSKYNVEFPMALATTFFDPLNKMTISANITTCKASERTIAEGLFNELLTFNKNTGFDTEDLFIFDRGYPAVKLFSIFDDNKKNFLMRCSTRQIKAINNAAQNGKVNNIIDLKFSDLSNHTKKKLKKDLIDYDENRTIKLRIITLKLSSGEKEILVTTLLDTDKYTAYELFNLYHKRWDIEENYKFHKAIASVENFSGKSVLTVEQDFYATIFTCNIAMLLMQEAQDEIDEVLLIKKLKYKYKINRNIGLGLLRNELMETLLLDKDIDDFCRDVKLRMQKSLVPVKDNRHFPRKKSSARKHSINQRSCM